MRKFFRTYYPLAKPGIIYGNILTATGGFLLASKGEIDWWLLLSLLVGMSMVIGSGCVFNNYIDRDIDSKMSRTKQRALVSGLVSAQNALVYAAALGILGISLLWLGTNALTVGIGLVGFVAYVVLYGYAKRHTVHGTLVGTISGATPILAGYCAVANRLDLGALLLFAILVCWQMSHFYAIATFRLKDYRAAGIPVLPAVKGILAAKIQIVAYAVAFIIAVSLLTIYGYAGYSYLVIMIGLGIWWVWKGLQGFHTTNDTAWARGMFVFSLKVITGLAVMLSLDAWLP